LIVRLYFKIDKERDIAIEEYKKKKDGELKKQSEELHHIRQERNAFLDELEKLKEHEKSNFVLEKSVNAT